MRYINKFTVLTALCLFISCAAPSRDSRLLKTKIADNLARYPAENATNRDFLSAELVQLGEDGILEVCSMLVPPGTGDDTNVRYALSGLTMYVSRPGAEEERKLYAKTIIKALELASDNEVKAFLIRQLQLAGKEEVVKHLAAYISDTRLYEPAVQSLTAIGTPKVKKELLKALPKTEGSNLITVVKALGELRCTEAIDLITGFVTSTDPALRETALYALANTGDPSSDRILSEAVKSENVIERGKAVPLYLLYAERLAESGQKDACAAFCRNVIGTGEENIVCAALKILVDVAGNNALDDLLTVTGNAGKKVRMAALELAAGMPGEEITKRWIEKLSDVPSETKAEIIDMLRRRGDTSALPVIMESLSSENYDVRMAAIPASVRLGGIKAVPSLFKIMQNDNPEEIELIKEHLLTIPGKEVVSAAADEIPNMPLHARTALLDIIGKRRAEEYKEIVYAQTTEVEDTVRIAAIRALENLADESDMSGLIELLLNADNEKEISAAQNAVIASALHISNPDQRADLILENLEIINGSRRADLIVPLSKIGGAKALETVIAETKSTNARVQEAAIRTLADWHDAAACDRLLNIFRLAERSPLRLTVLNGYVRLVREEVPEPDRQYKMLEEVMSAVETIAEKKLILAAFGDVRKVKSLLFIEPYLEDESFQHDAARVAARSALQQPGIDNGLKGADVIRVLKRAAEITDDDYLREEIYNHINSIGGTAGETQQQALNKPPEGFIALFNGKDLTGWKGLVGNPLTRAKMSPEELAEAQKAADEEMRAHWNVADSILVFDGKGSHLCTVRDYGDFEMYVDWKIEKEGDSGIYLRGSPQVQIWDPAQWHEGSGGLYNNQKNPNKPLVCADNPIGEWNTFYIKMVGERVTVYLNGELVVDDVVMENYWDRNQPIFPKGQIELQSHGSTLCFRNIFIRELPREGEWRKLFNEKDFAGWTGATDSYLVQDGKIVCPKDGGGNLYTEDEFSDFILRFEFRLTQGANNGLGIRAPLEGDAAYVGMELQILDNSALIYKDLKPYQYHGSIYGVVPAKRGYQRPVGEWNVQEVIAKGRRITVNLNGVTIVDADIDEASKNGTVDGREHPGLKRTKGHIGFLGHGSHVEFREIWLKEIE